MGSPLPITTFIGSHFNHHLEAITRATHKHRLAATPFLAPPAMGRQTQHRLLNITSTTPNSEASHVCHHHQAHNINSNNTDFCPQHRALNTINTSQPHSISTPRTFSSLYHHKCTSQSYITNHHHVLNHHHNITTTPTLVAFPLNTTSPQGTFHHPSAKKKNHHQRP